MHAFTPRVRTIMQLSFLTTISGLCVLPGSRLSAAESPLGIGDTVGITVFQNPDLSVEARVSPSGSIVVPLIGEVNLTGLSTTESAAVIAEQLKAGRFVNNPQVSVSLLQVRSRRVSVLGQVARPGQYPLDVPGLNLTDVLALAGGTTQEGSDTAIVITKRGGSIERLEVNLPDMYRYGDFSADIELAHGDTVYVPNAPVFYIYGAVQRAGAYRLEPSTPILAALSLGGGLTARGSERGIEIHRRMPDGSLQKLQSDLGELVQPNDVIFVRESLF